MKNRTFILLIVTSNILFNLFYSLIAFKLNLINNDKHFLEYIINTIVTHSYLYLSLLAYLNVYNVKIDNVFVFNKGLSFRIPIFILGGFVLYHLSIYLSNVLTYSLPDFGYNIELSKIHKDISLLESIIFLLVIVIISPIIEELFFRFFVYKMFRFNNGVFNSVLLNSVIFLLFHPVPQFIPFIILLNIYLCIIYELYNSVILTFIIHSSINLFSYCYNMSM